VSIEISPVTSPATLYIVATPIGNLGDISQRAIDVLKSVDIIAAEDTRHSRTLLNHLGIRTRLQAYHEHNESEKVPRLLKLLEEGQTIALISDAGTPLVNDPGYHLVEQAHGRGFPVIPVPGACAVIAALSASGLPTDRFVFEGFPPAKQGARINYLKTLQNETRTLVFYVSCHKLLQTLQDMRDSFGGDRIATLARELTKAFETINKSTLAQLCEWVDGDDNQKKGEMVVVIAGNTNVATDKTELNELLSVLVNELPVKQAARIAAKLSGANKNELYKAALELKDKA